LTQIKGITKEKAKLLLKTYGSIAKIAKSDVKSLTKIEKIGKITASNIKEALTDEKEVSY
jgi:ERCC4-type nuclease